MRPLLVILAAAGVLLAAEPSAFRAGNLNSNEPYGLNESEKAIRANQNSISALQKRVFELEQQVNQLSTIVEGLTASSRANGETLNTLRRSVTEMQESAKILGESEGKNKVQLDSLHTRQDPLETQVNTALKQQADNQKKLSQSITTTNDQFANTTKQLAVEIETNRKGLQQLGVNPNSLDGIPYDTMLNEVKKLIETKEYDSALARIRYLLSKQYKIPEVTFYLGTVHYFLDENDKALAAFQVSAKGDENAKYMPVLLYYSGVISERTKNIAKAKQFYQTVVTKYPDHSTADGAKKRLDRLTK